MKLILALALSAAAATPALRGAEPRRRLEALELLGAEESAKVEAEQEAARAAALAEAMAQLKEAQDMMAKAEALKAAAATAEAAPEAPKEPAAAEAPAEERVAVAAPAAPAAGDWEAQYKALEAAKAASEAAAAPAEPAAEEPAEPASEEPAAEPAAEAAAEPAAEPSDAAAEPAAEAAPEASEAKPAEEPAAEPAAEDPPAEASATATAEATEPTTTERIATDVAELAAGGGDPAVAAEAAALVQKLQAELKEESALLAALAAKLDAMRGDAPAAKAETEPATTEPATTEPATTTTTAEKALTVATWNIAAINNNPFEYWIHSEDEAYNKLMSDVQAFISEPGDKDVRVKEVFTDAMWDELKEKMKGAGWAGVDDVDDLWQDDYRRRKIVSGFLKDAELGSKRLASMPDRVTNTIRSVDGKKMRPTVINCYEQEFSSLQDWWTQWKTFIFETEVTTKSGEAPKPVYGLLQPIKRSKYPAISMAEEAVSLPLQTLAGAIFDSILVHMMNSVAQDTWQPLRTQLCEALNRKKDSRTLDILDQKYGDADIVFVQEAASSFVEAAKAHALGERYSIIAPASLDPKRDQNSLVLVKKGFGSFEEVDVLSSLSDAPVAAGDLLVVQNDEYVLASFHGDTNGLATIPITDAVLGKVGDKTLIFGLDANTYEAKRDGYQNAEEYQAHIVEKGLASQRGSTKDMDPKLYTTFNARTYLQPQLNKAVSYEERFTNVNVDRNPKDFVLFSTSLELVSTSRDNTAKTSSSSGEPKYDNEKMFPTLKFPSDHAITKVVLKAKN